MDKDTNEIKKQKLIHYTDNDTYKTQIATVLGNDFDVVVWDRNSIQFEQIKESFPLIFLIDLSSIHSELILKLLNSSIKNDWDKVYILTYLCNGNEIEQVFLNTMFLQPTPIKLQNLGLKTKEVLSQLTQQTKRIDELLLESKKQTIQQLVNTLSHYLNNSIAVMLGNLEILNPNDVNDVKKFTKLTSMQAQKILMVLDTLQQVTHMNNIRSIEFEGKKEYIFDIKEELEKRLEKLNESSTESTISWK